MSESTFDNPFRPGAGHTPPYLAGRTAEQNTFKKRLAQTEVSENIILTGLRGVGKTVLMETFKPIAIKNGWLWAGNDLSESASVTEETLSTRILADLSLVTSAIKLPVNIKAPIGFGAQHQQVHQPLCYENLKILYEHTPGLTTDKLKAVLEFAWENIKKYADPVKGIVFAYDEAQNLEDHAQQNQYPLSVLLEVFQSLQRKKFPFLLLLTGLPTLQAKLVAVRTYAERMFHVILLDKLTPQASREAIIKPIENSNCPIRFTEDSIKQIVDMSGGYPYFIQYICREVYDVWDAKLAMHDKDLSIPTEDIIRKLDTDFFQGRWDNTTDRQKELLKVVAKLPGCDDGFSGHDIVLTSKQILAKGFNASHVSQMLATLAEKGIVFRKSAGKYALAIPLMSEFITRQTGQCSDFAE